jgi:hypothetical protein
MAQGGIFILTALSISLQSIELGQLQQLILSASIYQSWLQNDYVQPQNALFIIFAAYKVTFFR